MLDTHRAKLSEFLKSCRGRVTPAEMGLPEPSRRRTPGLRREDVAALAGVSVTWYTWLEQGRDVKASVNVLERISSTLRMSPEERDYLFALVQQRPAPLVTASDDKPSAALRRMLDSIKLPALVMTIRWDVVAWNDLVTRLFRDYAKLPEAQRNLLKILLTDPSYQRDAEEYEAIARRVLAKFRVDYSQCAGDPGIEDLIADLNACCPAFRRLWQSPEITARSQGIHVFRHPQVGGITFEHTSYVPEGSPTLRIVIFAPYDQDSSTRFEKLLRERSQRVH